MATKQSQSTATTATREPGRMIPAFGRVLSRTEAAAHLGVTPRSLSYWESRGVRGRRLGRVKVGNVTYYRLADLMAFVDATENAALPAIGHVTTPTVPRPVADRLRSKGYKI